VQDGNYLGGSYLLEYQGKVTQPIPYNADEETFAFIVSKVVGMVSVARSAVDTEGGSSYLVTFMGINGDISNMKPQFFGTLTGVNSVVSVLENVKGAVASGSSLALSFESPLYCSFSQVKHGICGAPIDHYLVEIGDTFGNINSARQVKADFTTQIVRIFAPSMFDEGVFDGEDATGSFQLTYGDYTTGPISSHASAQDFRDAIEALPNVNTVQVDRTLSAEKLSSFVRVTEGAQQLICMSTTSCGFEDLPSGELIRIGGLWFTVAETHTGSAKYLPIGFANDSSMIATYTGSDLSSGTLYRWGRGFEWSVTFLSVKTETALPMSSPKASLNPVDTAISIRPADCNQCVFVDGLSVLSTYTLRIRAHNVKGYSPYDETSGTPREIPNAPNAVSVSTLSGSQLELYFSPPTGNITDITQYSIQWDHYENFSTVLYGTPSCSTSGYGECQFQGSALAVDPPYRYIINYLDINTRYYVRVAARNAISLATVSSLEDDPTKWSEIVSAVTANQKPSAPIDVTMLVSGPTSIQVLITPPSSDGGLTIQNYTLQWDSYKSFDGVTYSGRISLDPADLPVLQSSSGVLVYELTGLTSGVSYWVRVAAVNVIGSGPFAVTSGSVTPAGKPSSPSSVTVSTAPSQNTPITSADVAWTAPEADGGASVTGYMVEWWEGGATHEVQMVEFISTKYPAVVNGQFKLSFGPVPNSKENTGLLSYNSNPYNVRSELMNLGYAVGANGNFSYNFVIGDVRVSKAVIPQKGYKWLITFVAPQNYGDQVKLVATSSATSSDGETVSVYEMVSGSRPGGFSEIQIISIVAAGTNSTDDIGGWFRLSFNGAESQTAYLRSDASELDVQKALLQLKSLRPVSVTRSTIGYTDSSVSYAGYEWTVTFQGDVGNQPAIQIDTSLLFTSKINVKGNVYDGDNSLTASGFKKTNAYPGEKPENYNYRMVGKDDRSLTITGLVPGNTYYIAVSAVNSYGVGDKKNAPSTAAPIKQIPQPPTSVKVDVHAGSSSSLDVSYDIPTSDGGAPVLGYRVELDVTNKFSTPLYTVVPCPTSNIRSVYEIRTAGFEGDPIVDGFFNLTLKRNRVTFTTDYIPYDATAMLKDETGVKKSVGGLTATILNSTNYIETSEDAFELLFQGDRVQFDGQLYMQQVFTVLGVNGTNVTLDQVIQLNTSSTESLVHRIIGGRGFTTTSKVACIADSSLCPLGRREISGSMQSKLESIPEALIAGVKVDRDDPDRYNGVVWRVTFLDDSLPGSLNFFLDVAADSNKLTTLSGRTANVTVTSLVVGETYSKCVGTVQVPEGKALASGQPYYARVFAYNEIGYSLPQVAPSPQKPMVTPGPPTSVSLSVVSETELRVVFNPPQDDGGDAVTSYKIDYATKSDFSDKKDPVYVTYLAGGAPFFKTISGLKTGTFYYVRVSACNSQGCGSTSPSVPPLLNPYRASSAPSGVYLAVTSDTMLTVSFSSPIDNGGDAVVKYRVEWDISPQFNSVASSPHKGFKDLDARKESSYTMNYLTKGQYYYVRVSAINSAGVGTPALSTPVKAAPTLQVPGKPHTIHAVTGTVKGQIVVSWQRPRVPAHGIPCSGLATNPGDCPSSVGGGLPTSDGGSSIAEYEVSYNDLEDFSGKDAGSFTTTDTTYTLTGLTADRKYYIRVLARNAQGAGNFCRHTESNCLVVSTPASAYAKA